MLKVLTVRRPRRCFREPTLRFLLLLKLCIKQLYSFLRLLECVVALVEMDYSILEFVLT